MATMTGLVVWQLFRIRHCNPPTFDVPLRHTLSLETEMRGIVRELCDFIEFALPLFIFVGVGVLFLFSITIYVESYKCSSYAEMTGKRTEYKWFDSCYVETKDGWQRWDEYKVRAAASEGLNRMSKRAVE
jgi:hypothetical protein